MFLQFLVMFRKMRELHGTLTDVYGARRVHRLSLMVNRRGDIRTIYCVPCGPLTYIDHQSEESESESDDVNSNIKEDEYSKVLFDLHCNSSFIRYADIVFYFRLSSSPNIDLPLHTVSAVA